MGLKSIDALRSFCLELSSDHPAPGGGTASAAAGAMSASLLIMVCGVTGKSKKHADQRKDLDDLISKLSMRRDALLSLAKEDALAYDALVDASRKRRENSTPELRAEYQASLRRAAEIPARTASECRAVLEQSVIVASLQTMSASSDTLVAVMLAEAGFKGACANVRINLKDLEDSHFVQSSLDHLRLQGNEVKRLETATLARLGESV